MSDDDNVRRFPTETVDRVAKLAGTISKVMELSDADQPEDHMTALYLVQKAIEEAVMRVEGPVGLQRVLIAANERRKRYQVRWVYKVKKDED